MKTLKILLYFMLFIVCTKIYSQHNGKVAAKFDNFSQKNNLIGAALRINNRSYFYGHSNEKTHTPVNKLTVFGVGSITKTFVSVCILKLEARGKVNINDPITKYFPEYPKLKKVTIRSLMQMTAGLLDTKSKSRELSPTQQVNLSYKNYNASLKGKWEYSNVSYQLLGLLVEKITKEPLGRVIFQLIASPLGLSSIHFPSLQEAKSLKEYRNGKIEATNFINSFAAGGLVSNSKDLERFIRHLFVLKDTLPEKQYNELTSFVQTPDKYYAFTNLKAPEFGLGTFKWVIPPYGRVLSYPGVLKNGFVSTYVVVKTNVIIIQSNTYNNNDFTLLWPHRSFVKSLIGFVSINK